MHPGAASWDSPFRSVERLRRLQQFLDECGYNVSPADWLKKQFAIEFLGGNAKWTRVLEQTSTSSAIGIRVWEDVESRAEERKRLSVNGALLGF